MSRKGSSIFINTFFQGAVPAVTEPFPDGDGGETERVCVFPTEREAQLEIVDAMMIRLQQFIDGELGLRGRGDVGRIRGRGGDAGGRHLIVLTSRHAPPPYACGPAR